MQELNWHCKSLLLKWEACNELPNLFKLMFPSTFVSDIQRNRRSLFIKSDEK